MSGKRVYKNQSSPSRLVKANVSARPAESALEAERIPLHQYFVSNDKGNNKSRACSHNLEFLSKVFASDGASRFFKTFLLRFLFDSSGKSSDDCYGTRFRAA